MTTLTIDVPPAPVEFELDRLETRHAQPRAEVTSCGCFCSAACGHVGCSGCGSCSAIETG